LKFIIIILNLIIICEMGACTSVRRDKDPITATNLNSSGGVSKVTQFVGYKDPNKASGTNFGELNNSITLNR
jgi:hypothetical protein